MDKELKVSYKIYHIYESFGGNLHPDRLELEKCFLSSLDFFDYKEALETVYNRGVLDVAYGIIATVKVVR